MMRRLSHYVVKDAMGQRCTHTIGLRGRRAVSKWSVAEVKLATSVAKKIGGYVVPVFVVVRSRPKHDWAWALARLGEGHRVRRGNRPIVHMNDNGLMLRAGPFSYAFFASDFLATDWETVR